MQTRVNDGKKVGYYSIGVLPDYRQQGFAKSAVANVIDLKSREVDAVEALIVKGNDASMKLADSLGVVVKSAGLGSALKAFSKTPWGKGLGTVGSSVGTAGLIDLAVNKDKGAIGAYALGNDKADKWTLADFILNLGAGATKNKALIAGAAAKTIATPAVRRMGERNEIFEDIASTIKDQDSGMSLGSKLGLGLGAGALGLGAYGLYKHFKDKEEDREESSKPRVRLTLPTQREGDVETQIELKTGKDINLSKKMFRDINRDVKRKLRSEGAERTRRKGDIIDV